MRVVADKTLPASLDPRTRRSGEASRFALPLVGPAALLLLWAFCTSLGLVPPLLLPSPWSVARRLYVMLSTGAVLPDIYSTLARWAAGYSLGCLLGVPVGLVAGSSLVLFRATYPLFDFLRSIPVTALFPVFLLLFGIGNSAKIAMAFAATVFVIILNTSYGVLQAQKTRIRAAQIFGASPWQLFRWIIFFEALPQTLVGMRTSLSLSLIVVIVSEMFIGTHYGLGQRIFDAYTVNLTDELYSALVLTGFIGFVLNRLFLWGEARIVFWTGK
jgi:ABC-type nitrate/sulfonate/bicarbonate transport system permease component